MSVFICVYLFTILYKQYRNTSLKHSLIFMSIGQWSKTNHSLNHRKIHIHVAHQICDFQYLLFTAIKYSWTCISGHLWKMSYLMYNKLFDMKTFVHKIYSMYITSVVRYCVLVSEIQKITNLTRCRQLENSLRRHDVRNLGEDSYMKRSGHCLRYKSRILVSLSYRVLMTKFHNKTKCSHLVLFLGLISAYLSSTRVRSTSAHGILSWTVASNWTNSVLSNILRGLMKLKQHPH